MLMDTAYIMHYMVFSGGEYYLYHALRSIFGGWIIFVQCTTQYFRRANTIYITHYVVFSGGRYYLYYEYAIFSGDEYCLYYALRSIFWGLIPLYMRYVGNIFGGRY